MLAILPYALTSCVSVKNTGVDGGGGTVLLYHVRIIIPCYREPVSVIGKTLLAALQAPLPPHCSKTVRGGAGNKVAGEVAPCSNFHSIVAFFLQLH